MFKQETHVKIPTILHLTRFGYDYLSLKICTWNKETNIFSDIFIKSILKINLEAKEEGVKRILVENFALSRDFKSSSDTARIAFDADVVIFSYDSVKIYKKGSMYVFHENESIKQSIPLKESLHSKLLKILIGLTSLRFAIVTARNSSFLMRVIIALREWNFYVDEVFFLGNLNQDKILKEFIVHFIFAYQVLHLEKTKQVVSSVKPVCKTDSPLNEISKTAQFEKV